MVAAIGRESSVTRGISVRALLPAHLLGLSTLLFGMGAGGHARAEGLYVEGRVALGIATGHYEFEHAYQSEDGYPAVAHDEGGPIGIAIDVGATGGFAFDDHWALGAGARVELAPYLTEVKPRYSSLSTHALLGFGPVLTWRATREFELALAPEWIFASFAGSRFDIGATDNVYEFEGLSGPGCGFSLGQRWASGFGLALGVNVAALSSEHQTFIPVSTTLATSFSTF
jgi:hypothetical protein